MPAALQPCVNDFENARHKKQSCEGRENQAADDGSSEGSVLLAAFAEADGHGNHADDHGESGHDDRTDADEAGFKSGVEGILAFGQLFARKRDHQDAVGSGDAHAHDGAGKRRYVQRGVGDQENPADSGESAGERGDDDERINPGLKIDDDEQVGKKDGSDEADAEADKGVAHGLYLAANDDVAAAGQIFFDGLNVLEDLFGNRAEVAAVDGSVNVNHGLRVVVGDGCGACGGGGGDKILQNLRGCARDAAVDRSVLQGLIRVDAVLRGLHGNVVVDAVFGIEPEGRRGLKAGTKRNQDVFRNIAGLHADGLNAGAVDVHKESRSIEGLLHVDIDGAGNVAHLRCQFLRHHVIALLVCAGDGDVDRGRSAKIQDLRDDVRGLKEKLHTGIFLRKDVAQLVDVLGGTFAAFLLELHQDFGIGS